MCVGACVCFDGDRGGGGVECGPLRTAGGGHFDSNFLTIGPPPTCQTWTAVFPDEFLDR